MPATQTAPDARPNYGIDTPKVIIHLSVAGLACLLSGLIWQPVRWLLSPAFSLLATATIMVYASKIGKLKLRERMMDLLDLSGEETVLDLGCGSGLLLVAAAKRLTTGTAVGVDMWRAGDLSNTGNEAALRNAEIEGVSDRVRVEKGDARNLPFSDGSFDVIVSLNVLHNIAKRDEREQALREIIRVLKPGGRFLLADFRNTFAYSRYLRSHGVQNATNPRVGWVLFYPISAASGIRLSATTPSMVQ